MISNFIQSHIRQPKFQLGVILSLIFLSAMAYTQSIDPFVSLSVALVATVGSDLIFLKIRKKNLFFPSAALVTAFIIALITDPSLPWYDITLAGIAAMASKNFLRFSERHVFNPAAFGLFTAALIFNHNISWWGVSFQQLNFDNLQSVIYFLILLSPIFISTFRMRRFRMIISFLFIYGLFIIINSKLLILNSFLDPTVLFFALVMLSEPMTTPNNHPRQLLFGASVALLTVLLSSSMFNSHPPAGGSIFNFFDPLISSLLIGNLLFFRFR